MFIISCHLLYLTLTSSHLSKAKKCLIKPFIWDHSDLLMRALTAINFPRNPALTGSHMFCGLCYYHWLPEVLRFLPWVCHRSTVSSVSKQLSVFWGCSFSCFLFLFQRLKKLRELVLIFVLTKACFMTCNVVNIRKFPCNIEENIQLLFVR